jgi:hypothetical protein
VCVKAIAWAIETRVGDPALKILLIAIANYSDAYKRSWPSQKRLAYDTEISERTVRRKLNELVELGLISMEARRHPGGEVASSIITLNTSGQIGRQSYSPAAKIDPTSGQNGGSPAAKNGGHQRPPRSPPVKNRQEPSRTVRQEEPSDSPPTLSLGDASDVAIPAELVSPREQAERFFDKQFWPAYPKRFGSNPKEPARKKIVTAILNGEKPANILDGVNRLYSMLQRSGKIGTEYVPMALTWINRRSWNDDPVPAGNGKARSEMSFFDAALAMESDNGSGAN